MSLRRKRQFAMVGPGTGTQVHVGLNFKDQPETPRLKAMPPGGMRTHRVSVTRVDEVDAELLGWIQRAYDGAG